MRQLTIATGRSRTETEWQNKKTDWSRLVAALASVRRTTETQAEYKVMSKAQKGKIKDIGGFVGGTIEGGRRKAQSIRARSLVTLDIDYGTHATPGLVGDMLSGTAWCLYSTHSHRPEAPRYRLIVPLSRDVSPDEYIPIARRIADDIGIDLFDSSTYEPSRLMYWPSCPSDGEFIHKTGEGDPADADAILASYTDWRNVKEWPVDTRTVKITSQKGLRQEDPTEKQGLIGAFCRAYTIQEAITEFLPDTYMPTASPDRYTYAHGSTAGGLILYEDRFAYSHHGTDPCCGKLCNAFDLVRIHKFQTEDADADPDTPIAKLPSFVAMEKMIGKDRKVTALRAKEMIQELNDVYGEIPDDADTTWMEEMQMDERRKAFLPSPFNFGLIIRNDPRLHGCTQRDLFRSRDCVIKDLPWRKAATDPFWNNSDDNGLIDYVSKCYRLTGKTALLDACDLVTSQNTIHPVRDYLDSLVWDGEERLDTLLVDFLGAEDSAFTRAVTRKHFVAAVARVMRPGVKYDYVLTLIGPEGTGKSSLIRTMGGEWFDDSLTSIEGKEAMEQLRGKWLVEMGELTNYKKSTSEAYKAFLSKQEDSYRPAYGRKTEVFPRQCVFFATTNERNFLKGDTGNRRFWTVECDRDLPTMDVWSELPGIRNQIWAEALHRFRQGETLYLPRELEIESRQKQEEYNEIAVDERQGMIDAYLRKPLPADWEAMTLAQRQDYFRISGGVPDQGGSIKRETVCAVEVLAECFRQPLDERTRYRTREINQFLKKMKDLVPDGRSYDPVYGRQWRFRIRKEFWNE